MNVNSLILGGGVTGLSFAAFYDSDYLILEKNEKVGGYCKTSIVGEYVWDYSGHFFHFNNDEIKKFVTKNIDCKLLTVRKKTKIYYGERYIDFPFQTNIHQLDKSEFIQCLVDFYCREEKKVIIKSFKDAAISKYGQSISDKFVLPYNEKLYACNLETLNSECMGRFIPTVTLDSMFKSFKGSAVSSYNDNFVYPEKGCYEFIKSILTQIKAEKILTKTEVKKVDIEKKIAYTSNSEIKFNNLISTLPFNSFLKLCNIESNVKLTSNKVIVFNIGFNKASLTDAHWIYYPGKEIFYRVGFYNNILGTDKMSIYVEIGMEADSPVDRVSLFKSVIQDLRGCGVMSDHQVVDSQMLVLDPAYVHITTESKKFYNEWCSTYNPLGIYSIGRYGEWTYCSIEDNIIQAKKLAKNL